MEDEVIIRLDICCCLEDVGMSVLAATTAEEALHFLRSQTVQLLFTDIDLPGKINGIALASQVSRQWPDVGILVTSGAVVDTRELPDTATFFPKPYLPDQIIQCMYSKLSL